MRNFFDKMQNAGIFIVVAFILSSCVLDEFKFNEIQIKEELNMDIVSPLFHGEFEFKELIDYKSFSAPQSGEHHVELKFSENSFFTIPSRIIFEPTVINGNFDFFINGNYKLMSINLEYTVSNGCPFPFNFQMRFINKNNVKGVPVLPPAFLAGDFDGIGFVPVKTVHNIHLTEKQRLDLFNASHVEFSSWFNSSGLINTQDTFLANYPVEMKITLYGEAEIGN